MVTLPSSLLSSSSLRTASWMWRGIIRVFLLSLLRFKTSQQDWYAHNNELGQQQAPGSVACQLQDLGRQVLQHGGQVNGRTSADAAGILALLEVAGNTAHLELISTSKHM